MNHDKLVANVLADLAYTHEVARTRLLLLLENAADWNTQLSSPNGPGPKNAISDPTGAVAVASLMDSYPDDTRGAQRALQTAISELLAATAALRGRMARYDHARGAEELARLHDQHRGRRTTLHVCDQVLCDDYAAPDSIFCDPCSEWLRGHNGAKVVPRNVITDRVNKRKYREAMS